jgi:hypothetical protein
MGELEILTSPAYQSTGIISCVGDIAANLLRHGVTLGISSRGVGSIKSKGNQNIVQEDFELICFDLVSSPSTPGAYLFNNVEDREKYDETLGEEKDAITTIDGSAGNESLNLMKKLDSYLGEM